MTTERTLPGRPIALPGAEVRLLDDFLSPGEACQLAAALQAEIVWSQPQLQLFGRTVASPRLSCWMGDAAAIYTYSRTRFVPLPWHPLVQSMRDRISALCGWPLNSVLLNLYRDQHDSMGWHADAEPELAPQPRIASLSLGASRRFCLRRRGGGQRVNLLLQPGSLLLMSGATQSHYQHAVPKQRRPCEPRINLTFRQIDPSAADPPSPPS